VNDAIDGSVNGRQAAELVQPLLDLTALHGSTWYGYDELWLVREFVTRDKRHYVRIALFIDAKCIDDRRVD
jgi:hypothetical protein